VRKFLLRQAVWLPLGGMLLPMFIGFLVPGYSSIRQHMSELELLSSGVSLVTRLGALLSGLSIIGFAVALLMRKPMMFTAVSAFVFGLSIVSNGVFKMGSPLHGLYAIGLSVIVVPAFFAAEGPKPADRFSLFISTIALIYMWALMTGIDPSATRGLTQRLATIAMFGWSGYASFILLRNEG